MQVAAISREELDAWPIAEAGLPVRVVNAVREVPVSTVGQLRQLPDPDLLKLRSLGRISLGHIHAFFRICGQIEQGRQRFGTVQEVFALCLDDAERNVLAGRYGLDRDPEKPSRRRMTLQQIADAGHITRERVRQIQDAGLRKLQSRIAQVCLQPFYDYACGQVEKRGGLAGGAELLGLRSEPAMGGLNPLGLMRLLSEVRSARLVHYNGFFSTFSLDFLQALESRLTAILSQAGQPLSLDELMKRAGTETLASLREPAAAIECLLDHAPAVASTTDRRFFLYRNGAGPYVVEVLGRLDRPAHYRKITSTFNESLKPAKRKGAGYVLELLIATPRCTRVDRGIYDLKAE
ncbi:MAG TPA: sigma factor-like helix-turn-helix DNA-binding protein [Kiritimatiellia bacterium]|nr:sigma factor-like helix-turn-helix DNA-binding protein [Kiritimatiellia bacterium]HSA18489.1 sigma factor-like helix-turn-helix DNA-binding protein [Kiritimatiellia bacterium]